MDLRSLIEKLDTIEQTKLLFEAEELMERVGLRLQDIEQAVGRELDGNKRAAIIGDLARKYGYAGLFDPVSGKFVNKDGKFASFGAYQSEVEQLEDEGLIPNSAKTDALLGFMGKDEKDAKPKAFARSDLFGAIDKADGLLDKALDGISESSNISNSLLKEFGINTQLLEAITPEEHQFLKKTVKDAEPIKHKADANNLITRYTKEYIPARNRLIKQIQAVIASIKPAASATSTARSGGAANESLNESLNKSLLENKNRMITEGRAIILEDGTVIKDGQYYFYNESKNNYYHYDENGLLVEYGTKELWSDVKDTGSGVLSGATLGYQDELVAGALSVFKGTRFQDEFKAQVAATDAARQRSPWLYGGGQIAGFLLNPATKAAPWLATGAMVGREVFRPEINAAVDQFSGQFGKDNKVKPQPGKKLVFDPKVKELQKYLISIYGPNAVGKFKDDGKLGKDTVEAIKRAQKDGKLPANGSTPTASSAAPNSAVAAADSLSPGEEIVSTAPTAVASAPAASAPASGPDSSTVASAPASEDGSFVPDPSITQASVQSALAQVGVTGNTITPDQLLKVASALGIEGVAESKEITDIRRLAGYTQLDEVGEPILVPALRYGASKAGQGFNYLKGLLGGGGRAEASAARGTATADTTAAKSAASTSGANDVVNIGGETWRKTGNTWLSNTGKTKTDDAMNLLRGKKDGKLSPGGTRVAGQDTVAANASRRAASGVDDMVRGSRQAATADAAATANATARATANTTARAVLAPAARRSVGVLRSLGGRFVKFLKNNKFLTLVAILGAIGVVTAISNSDDTSPVNPQPGPNPNPAPGPNPTPGPNPQEEENKRKLADLEKLLAQLVGGWPTDPETAETVKAAIAAGAKGPEGFNPNASAVNTQPAANSTANSDMVFGGRGHAMSAEEQEAALKARRAARSN